MNEHSTPAQAPAPKICGHLTGHPGLTAQEGGGTPLPSVATWQPSTAAALARALTVGVTLRRDWITGTRDLLDPAITDRLDAYLRAVATEGTTRTVTASAPRRITHEGLDAEGDRHESDLDLRGVSVLASPCGRGWAVWWPDDGHDQHPMYVAMVLA